MATVAPPADQAADLLQKLSLDSQTTKTLEIPEPTKKPPVDSGDVTNGQIQSFDRSLTPLLPDFMDPTMCYLPNGYASYYYGGYDGTGNDWDDYSRYVNPDGVELTHGVYGDNGSLMYHHGYGYAPYGPYSPAGSPVPTVGHDGQLYGAQQYQFPTPYFQTLTPTSGPFPSPAAPPKGEISSIGAADQVPLSVEAPKGSSNGIGNGGGLKGNNGSAPLKTTYQNSSYVNGSYGRGALPKGIAASGYQDHRFGYDGLRSPIPWIDGPLYSDGHPRSVTSNSITSSISSGNGIPSLRNQNVRPHSHLMGLHNPIPMSGLNTANGFMNGMYPNKLYSQYGNAYRSGYYGSNGYDSRTSGRGWSTVDSKCKPRGRGNGFLGYGNENMDGLNELNRGPRAKSSKNQKGFTPITLAVKGQNIPLAGTDDCEEKPIVNHDREQLNRADFPENYADAKFFVIKSYSEDDVHKSIKYNVWASTQNGNKKLDASYQEAQQKSGECPIFLFFSVNTSGQFVGVAEMLGPVDFNKSLEYWQQDKWVGCFPVKWHIVKDVPNSMLKHITLENNENKPVTNSRDTQEVKLEQGLELLKIFKDHSSKQCILDDFDFYEERQKRIQEKKAKQQQFQKQVWEGKPADEKNKEGSSQKLTDVALDLIKDVTPAIRTNGDVKPSDNPTVVKVGEGPITEPVVVKEKVIPKVGEGPITEPVVVKEKVIPNVVANGC